MPAPLSHAVVDIVGVPFQVIWTPEDETIRAAGFVRDEDPSLTERLAKQDPTHAQRGLADAATTKGPIVAALRAYAKGDLTAIDALRVGQAETPFRGEVWRALRTVPAGRTVSYTELAALAGRPTAVRAAASGCANNLVPLVVPCHRILRSDGSLGGYLFGTDLKKRLLQHEGVLAG